MPDRKPDNYGRIWWETFYSKARLPVLVEGEEESSVNNSPQNSSNEYLQLMSLLDTLKLGWWGENEKTEKTEIFPLTLEPAQLDFLSSGNKDFIVKGDGKGEITASFIFKGGVNRTISLESGGRRLQFILDIESASGKNLQEEFKEGEWMSKEFKLNDLTDPINIARLGVKMRSSLGRPGSP